MLSWSDRRKNPVGNAAMRNLSPIRLALTSAFAVMLALGWLGLALGQTANPHGVVVRVDGVINPVKERLIERTLREAYDSGAELAIFELDTPGGLLDSTRNIVAVLLESPTTTVVYVSPSGANAGSAGTFIAAAAHFAVMAPGSNIGAATPVSGSGADLPNTLADKATNDAASLIRSIAQERGRNAAKLEDTVRSAASYTAREAVDFNVADFIAEDLNDLLTQLDGQPLPSGGDEAAGDDAPTVNTQGLQLRRLDKTVLEHFLEFISNPNVAFLLLTIGALGIVIELFSPGLIIPGVIGVICLLLAFLGLGNLPVNWIAVGFIVLAGILAVLEFYVAGWGALGVGAIVSFLVGGFLLFSQWGVRSPAAPDISVHPGLPIGFAVLFALPLGYFVWEAWKSRKDAAEQPVESPSLVGRSGLVTRDIAPRGVVQVSNDTWTAVSEDGTVIRAGSQVIVTRADGLILTCSPQSEPRRTRRLRPRR